MKFQNGDIIFIMNHHMWISRTIAWFMGSKWSHCGIVIDRSVDRTYTTETTDYEVAIGILESYLYHPSVSIEVYRAKSLSEDEKKMIVSECLKNLWKTYGYLQLISLGIRRLLIRYLGIKIGNFFRQGIICCGHVLYGYSKTSLPVIGGIDPESIDTEELYVLVKSIKDQKGKPVFERVAQKYASTMD